MSYFKEKLEASSSTLRQRRIRLARLFRSSWIRPKNLRMNQGRIGQTCICLRRVTPKWRFNISLSDASRCIFCLSHRSSSSTTAVYFSVSSISRLSRLKFSRNIWYKLRIYPASKWKALSLTAASWQMKALPWYWKESGSRRLQEQDDSSWSSSHTRIIKWDQTHWVSWRR